jgi:hypothetical protein
MNLLIEVLQGRKESARNTMLLVKIDSFLDALIANYIAVSEILSNDTRSWLLLLRDFIAVALAIILVVTAIIFVGSSRASNLDVRCTKLGVIK